MGSVTIHLLPIVFCPSSSISSNISYNFKFSISSSLPSITSAFPCSLTGTSTTYTELSKKHTLFPFFDILLLSHLLISHPLLLSHYLALHSHLSHSLISSSFSFCSFSLPASGSLFSSSSS